MSVYVSLKLETLQQGCLSYALVTQLGDLAETESSAQASAHSYPLHPWCILSLYTFFSVYYSNSNNKFLEHFSM